MCQSCSLLFMRPLSPPTPILCSRDAGGVSLLKMLFHHLLDLRLSACIKGLHLDRESASTRRPIFVHPRSLLQTFSAYRAAAKSCVAPLPLPGITIAIGQTPPPPHQNQGRGREKSQILLYIDPIYVQESGSINHNSQPDSKQITDVPQRCNHVVFNQTVNICVKD